MHDTAGEIELRVEKAGRPAGEDAVAAALKPVDPTVEVRFDERTGIVHVRTTRDALEITSALGQAGFDASAMTG